MFLEAIYHRCAILAFTSEAIEKELIDSLIDAAFHAPNAIDKQRWVFVIVSDRALMRRISEEARELTLRTIGSSPDLKPFADMRSSPDLNIFYDAPVLIVICATDDDQRAPRQCVDLDQCPTLGSNLGWFVSRESADAFFNGPQWDRSVRHDSDRRG